MVEVLLPIFTHPPFSSVVSDSPLLAQMMMMFTALRCGAISTEIREFCQCLNVTMGVSNVTIAPLFLFSNMPFLYTLSSWLFEPHQLFFFF